MPSRIPDIKVAIAAKVNVVVTEQRGEDPVDADIIQQSTQTTAMQQHTKSRTTSLVRVCTRSSRATCALTWDAGR
eukprot:COSAG03_NODE_2356_length_2850_cov_5.985758_3_plen_75_part_00